MNKSLLLTLSLCCLLASCNTDKNYDYYTDIEKIENGLLPMVLIKGEEVPNMNILERMEYHNVPGVSIAFMDKGEIQWAKGYGYTDSSQSEPINDKTLFQAASISKPVAALAALQLVEEGKFDLDDDVNDFLVDWQLEENEFTIDDKVTIRRILSHSAGLTVHGFGGYSSSDTIPGIIDILDGTGYSNSGRIFPDIAPGTIYRYSGGGYTVMQKMLCDITAMEFPELMDELVLGPLGMESSTYRQPLPANLEDIAAHAHYVDGTPIEGRWHTYPEMAAAGLWTTPSDLLRYALEVQQSVRGKSNKVISKEMTREMLKPQINSHGLGPGLRGRNTNATFGHGGSNAGYRCQLTAFSWGGQGLAIMTNSDNGDALMGEILRSFSKLYDWKAYKPIRKEIINLDIQTLEEFTGVYILNNDDRELKFSLIVKDNHLAGKQLWDNFEFEIFPEEADMFFNKADRSNFVFERNEDGRIYKVIVQDMWHFDKIE